MRSRSASTVMLAMVCRWIGTTPERGGAEVDEYNGLAVTSTNGRRVMRAPDWNDNDLNGIQYPWACSVASRPQPFHALLRSSIEDLSQLRSSCHPLRDPPPPPPTR